MNSDFNFIMTSGTMKTMEVFAGTAKCAMEAYFGAGYKVIINKVNKNNGLVLTGLVILDNGSNIAPTIYLDEFFERYRAGELMADLCREIIEFYQNNKVTDAFDIGNITEFAKAKSRVCYKLVNAEKNRELLREVPHVIFHDLAVVYYVLISVHGDSIATAVIREDLFKKWGVSEAELYKLACANTQRIFGSTVKSMADVLSGLMAEAVGDECADELIEMLGGEDISPMYVVTNNIKINGASVMLNKRLLRTFSDRIGGSYYILPSSINEVIFMPIFANINEESLKDIVREINKTTVLPEEVLSDNVYFYDRELDRVEMI